MSSPHTLHNYNSLNRGQTVRRIPELIDGLKAEYDTLLRDTNMFVMQRDEYEKQLEYHRQEAQRIQDQLFELEHYHKDIVARYQEEIEYLKRQLEHADHGNTHDSHVLNSMKYEKQRVLLPPGGPRVTAFGAPNLPPASRAGPGAGGLPGVLSSLGKTDPVVAGVVSSGGAGNGRGLPPPSGVRVGTPGLRGSGVGNGRPVERGVLVVGGSGTPIEGGEESAPGLIIEEQDIVMASVNPSDK